MEKRAVTLVIFLLLPLALLRGQTSSTGVNTRPSSDEKGQTVQSQHLFKLSELTPEDDAISSLTISPDDELIAYTIDRRKLSKPRRLLNVFGSIDKLFAADSSLKIWNRRTGRLQATIQDQTVDGFFGIHFTSGGKTLLTRKGFDSGVLQLWDLQTGALNATLTRTGKPITMAILSPNRKFYAAALEDGTAYLWDIANRKLMAMIGQAPEKTTWWKRLGSTETYVDLWVNLQFSPDSSMLITSARDRVKNARSVPGETTSVWDTTTGRLKFTLPGAAEWGGIAANVSNQPSLIVTVSSDRGAWGTVSTTSAQLWNANDGSLWRTLDGVLGPVRFSPDGRRLATGLIRSKRAGTENVIAEIWDLEKGHAAVKLTDSKSTLDEILWSPDGHTLITTGGKKYTLTLWDADSGQMKNQFRLVRRHCFDLVSDCISDQDRILMSPDGRLIIAASQKSIRLIDLKSATLLETIEGIGEPVAFLSDGRPVTLSPDKRTVLTWDVRI